MTTCSIEECTEPVFVKARGWCKKHYTRWYRTGDPLTAKYDRGTGPDRWRAKYTEDANGCWIWTGGRDRHGYGQYDVTDGGVHRNWRAHRYVYEQLVRPLAADETLDHLCRVHACVNPAHLEPTTHLENVQRGDAGAANRDKTHCPQGHPYDEDNTYITPRGGRECRACSRGRLKAIMREKRGTSAEFVAPEERTHCPKGHEYTEANTIRNKKGHRECRECSRIRMRTYMASRRNGHRRTS